MQTFFKRLLLIVENQGFKSLNDFALNGLKYESSSKLNRLKDEKNKPSIEILLDITNKFQTINLNWLITGKGEMLLNKENKVATNEVAETQELYTNNALINEQLELLKENIEVKNDIINMQKIKIAMINEKLIQCENEKKLHTNNK